MKGAFPGRLPAWGTFRGKLWDWVITEHVVFFSLIHPAGGSCGRLRHVCRLPWPAGSPLLSIFDLPAIFPHLRTRSADRPPSTCSNVAQASIAAQNCRTKLPGNTNELQRRIAGQVATNCRTQLPHNGATNAAQLAAQSQHIAAQIAAQRQHICCEMAARVAALRQHNCRTEHV